MKNVILKKLIRRVHSSTGWTSVEFVDEDNILRTGRIIPGKMIPVESFMSIMPEKDCILIPDGQTSMDGGTCLSLPSEDLSPITGAVSLEQFVSPLRALHGTGLNHLSLDSNSFMRSRSGTVKLIFWGDGLFSTNAMNPPEVLHGGFPGPFSDHFMAARAAIGSGWLMSPEEIAIARQLISSDFRTRNTACMKLGYETEPVDRTIRGIPAGPVVAINGGDWRTRDACVNSILMEGVKRGWFCRSIRCATGEKHRPLPDIPPGLLTSTPEQFLKNALGGNEAIETLLVINDITPDREDLLGLITALSRVIPSGLHLFLVGADVPDHFSAKRICLEGKQTSATDITLSHEETIRGSSCAGPSWYGPRCRIPIHLASGPDSPEFSRQMLFAEGAWRWIAGYSQKKPCDRKAESLLNLGRSAEALGFVTKHNRRLRAKILIDMKDYAGAMEILDEKSDPLLAAEACSGMGMFSRALEILSHSPDPRHQCRLSELHDLCGNPAAALGILRGALTNARGTVKVDIYCALRNLEMRLGYHEEALEHAEEALKTSRETASVNHLVKSLQGRGRTLEVLGRWREAIEDYKTAVHFHDDCALSLERPPHVDLFVLELRMGLVARAKKTLAALERMLASAGAAAAQMHLMLRAYMGVLLGYGERAVPYALRAEKTASLYGMKLYSGISSLYAGQLYIQTGNTERGLELLNKARATGHVLGDGHLVFLTDIELMFAGSSAEICYESAPETRHSLVEESLAMSILSGRDENNCYRKLLELPSPLLACRLAGKLGLPDDPALRKQLLDARRMITGQLEPGERDDYDRMLGDSWEGTQRFDLLRDNANQIMSLVSKWVFEHLEGESDLDALQRDVGLEHLSTSETAGMLKVPSEHPLYCSGPHAEEILPFLIPAAAAMAYRPEIPGCKISHGGTSDRIIGISKGIRRVCSDIERYAVEDIPILLTGETGTGKEICAREIHSLSPRAGNSFIPVDCGAIPENLLESEFFGASPGAYTGINLTRKGLLEEAHGGTLFLDEIGNLPLQMQVKLLRALDSGRFRRLGETAERRSDTRIIAATNANMEEQISSGSFRSDLFYRIAVVRIDIPPLRRRKEDIALLAEFFSGKRLSPGAVSLLEDHSWPGNVRELLNVMKRASITASGHTIRRCDISFNPVSSRETGILSVHDMVKKHIAETVESLGGNRTRAAEVLRCDPKTIRRYLNEGE